MEIKSLTAGLHDPAVLGYLAYPGYPGGLQSVGYRSTCNFHFCVYMACSSLPVLPGCFHPVSAWRDIPSGLDDFLPVNGNSRDEFDVNTHAIIVGLLSGYCYGNR